MPKSGISVIETIPTMITEQATTVQEGKSILLQEADAIRTMSERLDENFSKAVELMLCCAGKVVISGMGKSGIIGQKIAATAPR